MEDILLKACMNEELTSSERIQLQRWLSQSADNRRQYQQMQLSMLNPDENRRSEIREQIWENLTQKLENSNHHRPNRQTVWNQWLKLAAVFVVLITFGAIVYHYIQSENSSAPQIVEVKLIEKMSMPGQQVTTQLPDGTVVKLNADSRLIVPENFAGDIREVTLFGEAFFEVKRDENHPFVIRTKDVDVQVLGTSFNVRSYPDENASVVSVATGKVSVSKDREKEYLAPGEKVTYSSSDGLSGISHYEPEKEFGWRERILLLDAKNLHEIVHILSRWYGVEIEITNENIDASRLFSGRYKDPSLKMVLEGISYVYQMEYEITNKKIILK